MTFSKIRLLFLLTFFFVISVVTLLSQTIILPNSNKEIMIDSNRLTIYWKTFFPSDTKIEYGETDSYELGSVYNSTNVTEHTITIPNLKASTAYYLRCKSKYSSGESVLSNWIVSTSSQNSSGTINVYFNKSVNPKIAISRIAAGDADFSGILINRIDSAKYTIDMCVYSFSGTVYSGSTFGVGTDVADALIRAKNRDVKVRFIMEEENQNTSPVNKMKGAGITIITDLFGKNDGKSLHHNKFFIFDARDAFTDKEAWVITGSWNVTNPGTYNDYQNIVEIQDKSLANAYTLEFNEMWGSTNEQPNSEKSKFGKNKTDNTPHRFNIKGIPVELYFAPSDGVSYQIQNKILNSNSSVMFSEMSFTSDPIAQSINSRIKSKNIKIRGLINKSNLNDQGNEFDFLNSIPNSVVKAFDAGAGIFHHKYMIIDGDRPDLSPIVMTGSYNLSASAESQNDENLLFIQNSQIANLYLQEFTQRYIEAGGNDTIKILKIDLLSDVNFRLFQNFPNPFNSSTTISYSLGNRIYLNLKIINLLGQEVQTLYKGFQEPGNYNINWNPGGLPSGIYYYRLEGILTDAPGKNYYPIQNKMLLLK